ncbi:MAG: transposase, partial [Lutispora sp.]|nr:transposase [Lutispora sp.]
EIALRYAEYLYLKTYDELQTNEKYKEAFGILWDIIDQYTNNKTDKIVSVVDPEAKIAHKSRGNIKRGYKDLKKRSKVERRFATLVRNHGLRRCRYLKLKGAKTHITLANMACNIIRMVNLLCPPNIAMSNI